MSGTLDTLQIVFTAEAGPLTSQLEHITRQLGNVNVASETAQTGLRGLAGAMQGSFSALSDRAYAAGAAAGRALPHVWGRGPPARPAWAHARARPPIVAQPPLASA